MIQYASEMNRPVAIIAVTVLIIVIGSFGIFSKIAHDYSAETAKEHAAFLQGQTQLVKIFLEPLRNDVSRGTIGKDEAQRSASHVLEGLSKDLGARETGIVFWGIPGTPGISVPAGANILADAHELNMGAQRISSAVETALKSPLAEGPFTLQLSRPFNDAFVVGYAALIPELDLYVGTFAFERYFPMHAASVMTARIWGVIFVFCLVIPISFALRGIAVREKRLTREIRDREQAESVAREADQFKANILDSAQEGMVVIDKEHGIQLWNAFMEKLTGLPAAVVLGSSIAEQYPFLLDADGGAFFERALRGESVVMPQYFFSIPGTGRSGWVESTLSPFRNAADVIIGVLAVTRDIGERKAARDALRESEERFKKFMTFFPGCAFIKDSDGRFVFINKTYEETFGIEADFCYGKTVDEIFPRHAVQRIHSEDAQILQGNAVQGEDDMRPVADGSTHNFFTSRFPVYTSDGRVFIGGIHIDITAQKRQETERQQLEERLQRAEKMEALGTLAGGVAHDLNNILSGIVSYPDMLLMQVPADSPLRRPLMTIKQSGERAAAVVQDLLTLARRSIKADSVVSLNAVVDDYFSSPEYKYLQDLHPTVSITRTCQPDLLPIKGSAIHLNKLMMNLVLNAAEAIEQTGSVTVSTRNEYIDRTSAGYEDNVAGDYVVLEVKDSGKGILSADIEKIFEPFYTNKKMGRSGTGLGLAVVWGIVKDHDAFIDVKSEPGHGSIFTIFFPASRLPLSPEEIRADISHYGGKGESILIVDDIHEQREIASVILGSLGYAVTPADGGDAALALMRTKQFDLVLLDMIMTPEISGLETYRQMLVIRPGQRAVVVSGFAETDDVKEAMALGAGGYLKKPYLLHSLAAAVRAELDRS